MKSIAQFIMLLLILSACSTQRVSVEPSGMQLSSTNVIDSSQYVPKISIDIAQLPTTSKAKWGRKYSRSGDTSKVEFKKTEYLSMAVNSIDTSDTTSVKPQKRKLKKGEAKSFFILGIIGFIPLSLGVPSVLAVILSWHALKKRLFNDKSDEDYTKAGFVLGVVALAFWIPIGFTFLIASILSIWL